MDMDSDLVISPRKAHNHRDSFVVWVAVTYSTLVMESGTKGWFFEL